MHIHIIAWALGTAVLFLGGLVSTQSGLQVMNFYSTPDQQDQYFLASTWFRTATSWNTRPNSAAQPVSELTDQHSPSLTVERRSTTKHLITANVTTLLPAARSVVRETAADWIIAAESEEGEESSWSTILWNSFPWSDFRNFIIIIIFLGYCCKLYIDRAALGESLSIYVPLDHCKTRQIEELKQELKTSETQRKQSSDNQQLQHAQCQLELEEANRVIAWQKSQLEKVLEANASEVKDVAQIYSSVQDIISSELNADAESDSCCADEPSSNLSLQKNLSVRPITW
ncbi:hypothetical protein PV10_02703 [Exophiala mesophila]|uniref:Uncharacterized protein n=1 Tax=Exophiala mesophila TaxID=212818 RepID=A0A0D1ZM48_EXOME|nr:uncharacterized protein PV10_02703 [Exophiala mesophila]KIV94994.1 hypothetical protein PV10_02703 [Exophiala mesophila]